MKKKIVTSFLLIAVVAAIPFFTFGPKYFDTSMNRVTEIGRRNGLIGIGLWETAVCGTDAKATAQSIKYVADKIGVDKVALGSDFDGALTTHFDVTGLPLIYEALKNEGFNNKEVEIIMGGNVREFLLRNLPGSN